MFLVGTTSFAVPQVPPFVTTYFIIATDLNRLQVIIEDATKCDKTVEEWECTFCTFLNSGEDRIRCQMCQGERSEGGKSADQPEMQKQCPFCTLLNMPHREKCAACEGVLN